MVGSRQATIRYNAAHVARRPDRRDGLRKRVHPDAGSLYGEDFGGAEGIRTPDLINAIDALSQLSYSPTDNNHNPTNRNTSYFNPPKTPIRSFPAPVSVIWASLVRAPLRFAKGASRSSPAFYKWPPLSPVSGYGAGPPGISPASGGMPTLHPTLGFPLSRE